MDQFYIPANLIPDGISYEWKRWSVCGWVDDDYLTAIARTGWEPVRPKDQPSLVPPGYDGGYILRGGMILMQRSAHLTEKAILESNKITSDVLSRVSLGIQEKGFSPSCVENPGSLEKFLDGIEGVVEDGDGGCVIVTLPARIKLSALQQDAAETTYPKVDKKKAYVAYANEILKLQLGRIDLYSELLHTMSRF